MPKTSQEYHLLGEESSEAEEPYLNPTPRRPWVKRVQSSIGLYVFLFCSVILNVAFVGLYIRGQSTPQYFEDARSKWGMILCDDG